MKMKFVALDVETANADMSSICSIGAAVFEGDKITSEYYSLVNPKDYFDEFNVSVHGITKNMVKNAPTYLEAAKELHALIFNEVVVTHTHFDRVAIHQACSNSGVSEPTCSWLDSARVARRTWQECANSGYGLARVCELIGYQFDHHHALEDAKAAGYVLLAAMQRTGLDLEGLLARVRRPINLSGQSHRPGEVIRREGNREGPLFGEVVVFTGALALPRREAADLAASVGCQVDSGITKKTTILVVGDTDIQRLAGHEKSTKYRKAEYLNSKGASIRIIRETDFRKLVNLK
jgi:DNA polymerase-3 subunit epsilon